MDESALRNLLERLRSGECMVDEALAMLKHWPAESLDFACLDHQRRLRTGVPEVVFGENKSAEQIAVIMRRMLNHSSVVLATRITPEKASLVCRELPELVYHLEARMLTTALPNIDDCKRRGEILVISAGTSDIPVAEEAYVTAISLGNQVKKLYDVGVAGIHRLFAERAMLKQATVLIVVAGMEGALPSVIGGMVDKPLIAVPTSVGYGTGLGGVAALLGMLTSCVPGVMVVNIDNGFGAACAASSINRV